MSKSPRVVLIVDDKVTVNLKLEHNPFYGDGAGESDIFVGKGKVFMKVIWEEDPVPMEGKTKC